MREAERDFRRGAFIAMAIRYGVVWGAAGLAWAGALGQPLFLGLVLGLAVALVGSAIITRLTQSTDALLRRNRRRSPFGGLGSVLAVVGAIVWLAT